MKKILSLLVVATLMLCLLSVSAFAQATIIYEGQSADGITSNNAGSVVNDTPATIIDSNGNSTVVGGDDGGTGVIILG